MSSIVFQGQRLTIGFLVLCCVLAVFYVLRGLVNASQVGLLFALARTVFALFNGVAAWSIYQSKKAGRYLGWIVVLPWFGSLVNIQGRAGGLTLVLAVQIALVGIWLYLPGVRAKFEVKKVFA